MTTFATKSRAVPALPVSTMRPFRRTPSVRAILRGPRIQAKPMIGAVNDPAEREADRVADQVVRMTDHDVAVGAADVRFPARNDRIRRLCAECEDELQRKEDGDGGYRESAASATQTALDALCGGTPLPTAERAFFEPRFGRSFGTVRIHTGAAADAAARAVNARAFTLGEDIAFARDQYAPGTAQGRRLLAHELTHSVQQDDVPRRAGANTTGRADIGIHEPPAVLRRQAWLDVERIESFPDRAAATTRMRQLQREHPRRQYRVVRRGRASIIQFRDVTAGSWRDVRQIESFPDRAGATERMRRLQREHRDLQYRVVRRGRGFAIQYWDRAATSRARPGAHRTRCGRPDARVSDFPATHIVRITVDMNNLANGLHISWNRDTRETRALGARFPISPGAGRCNVCCNRTRESRSRESLCTPIGSWTVHRINTDPEHCQLETTSWAHNATYFDGRGIAIHTGPLPGFPASHGCVRTTARGSAIVHDNSRTNVTIVDVNDEWSGRRCYAIAASAATRARVESELCTPQRRSGSSASSSSASMLTAEPEGISGSVSGRQEAPPDGAGPA